MNTRRFLLPALSVAMSLLSFACGSEDTEAAIEERAATSESAIMAVEWESLDDEGKSCKNGKTTYTDGSGRYCKQGPDGEWRACCCRDGEWKTEKFDEGCSMPQ